MFAVRQGKTHGKQSVFAVRLEKTHDKGGRPLRGITGQQGEALANADYRASLGKRTANICVCRAPVGKRTANNIVTVRLCLPCARWKTHRYKTHGKDAFS
jgi:hypothetical protein